MSTNFLTENDLTFQNNNDDLKGKYEIISQFTSMLLLDLAETDADLIKEIKGEFELLKERIFQNSDEILKNKSDLEHKNFLIEIQTQLLNNWKDFGFTEGFFHRYYQIQKYVTVDELSSVDKERVELLLKIIKEQELIVITFGVLSNKNPPVIIDVEEYL